MCVCVFVYLSVYLSSHLSVYLLLSLYLHCARRLQFLSWATSKTKEFCETSSMFQVDNIKNEAILRDFFQEWKVECRADGLIPLCFVIVPLHLSKVLRLSRKIVLADLQIWCSKMQPLSGNRRDVLTSLMKNISLVLRLPSFLELLENPHVLLPFGKVHNPLHLPRKKASEPSKVVRACRAFDILTSKCASCHNGVHFFNISTFKSALNRMCFVHVDFEKCFAPQRRTLFQPLNFQKCSEPDVFCKCWLRNVLRATWTCNLSTSQLPKLLWTWWALYMLTSKCASRHMNVQFVNLSTSKIALNVLSFVHFDLEMCFAPQRRALFRHLNFQKCSETISFNTFDFEMCFAPQQRALFRHLNFQKWSEPGSLCAFWLRNVLRATMACTFSTLQLPQLPKVVRAWCALYILTWECASRHNSVQFLISRLASWLRTRRFSEPTFQPS